MNGMATQQVFPIRPVTQHPAVFLDIERAIGYAGDEAATRDLLQMVEQSLKDDIGRIWQKLEAGDIAAASRLVHAIKGFVPIFCGVPLVEQVKRAEAMSKTQSAASFKLVFAELAPALLLLLEEIRAYLSAPSTLDRGGRNPGAS
jgi:HPt (histidine-containing phosphotransfer) domain-containing protein